MPDNSHPIGTLPETGYVRQSQLIPVIFPFSPATLWRKVKAGTFPKPVKLGPRITAWRVEDIRALMRWPRRAFSLLQASPHRRLPTSACLTDRLGR